MDSKVWMFVLSEQSFKIFNLVHVIVIVISVRHFVRYFIKTVGPQTFASEIVHRTSMVSHNCIEYWPRSILINYCVLFFISKYCVMYSKKSLKLSPKTLICLINFTFLWYWTMILGKNYQVVLLGNLYLQQKHALAVTKKWPLV